MDQNKNQEKQNQQPGSRPSSQPGSPGSQQQHQGQGTPPTGQQERGRPDSQNPQGNKTGQSGTQHERTRNRGMDEDLDAEDLSDR